MIKILFFAAIREQLGCDCLEWQCPAAGLDLELLEHEICAAHGAKWTAALGQENTIRAVNQVVVSGQCRLKSGDEVAFFPPVTGG